MKYSTFGAPDGQLVVYFHGVPGASFEAQIFDVYAKAHGLKVICQDRFAVDLAFTGDEYFQLLADHIGRLAKEQRVDVVGFSIGAFVALQVCRLMPHRVRSLHLISAAAPLEGCDFLKAMAGKQVFELARDLPVLFKLLTRWQSLLARYFPNTLFGMLFASAVAGDHPLRTDQAFKTFICRLLTDCFGSNASGYLRDVLAYVTPWQASLGKVTVKTQLWHGDQDNWSPCAMATYLKQQLPVGTHIHCLEGLSHYSSLYAAAPQICEQICRSEPVRFAR